MIINDYRKAALIISFSIIGALGLWYAKILAEKRNVLKKKTAFEGLNYVVKLQIREALHLLGI